MSQLGMGVMLQMLGGNKETAEALQASLEKPILNVKLEDSTLKFQFEDNSTLNLFDAGQSCCEERYMSCDDDLQNYTGAKILNVRLEDAEASPDEHRYDEHEVQFLKVDTDRGTITCQSHNIHNGYYGGFGIVASLKPTSGPY